VEGKSEGILCRPTVPHLQIRICHCAAECHREEDVNSTDSALWSLRLQVTLCEASLSFTNCTVSRLFHSANFWKIQIFIDSNFKLTTTCCYPYISLWSFSKLIHDNMGFGLWWVRFGSDTLPWHMVSSFMILWCRLMRHQSFKFKLQIAITLKPHKEIPWMVKIMVLEASPFLPSLILWPISTSPNHFLLTKGITWLATFNILDCMGVGKVQ